MILVRPRQEQPHVHAAPRGEEQRAEDLGRRDEVGVRDPGAPRRRHERDVGHPPCVREPHHVHARDVGGPGLAGGAGALELGARQERAAGLEPVRGERGLHLADDRALRLDVRVSPPVRREAVAAPLRRDAEAAREPHATVHHDELAVVPAGEGERVLPEVPEVAHLAARLAERAAELLLEPGAAHRVDEDADREPLARPPADDLGEPRARLARLPDVHVDVQAVAGGADRLLHRVEHLAVVPPREAVPFDEGHAGRLHQGEPDLVHASGEAHPERAERAGARAALPPAARERPERGADREPRCEWTPHSRKAAHGRAEGRSGGRATPSPARASEGLPPSPVRAAPGRYVLPSDDPRGSRCENS